MNATNLITDAELTEWNGEDTTAAWRSMFTSFEMPDAPVTFDEFAPGGDTSCDAVA